MAHARDDAREHMPSGSADDGREVEHLSARAGIATKTMLSRMNCDSIVSPSRARYILSPPFVRRLHHSVSKHHGVQPDLATYVRPRGERHVYDTRAMSRSRCARPEERERLMRSSSGVPPSHHRGNHTHTCRVWQVCASACSQALANVHARSPAWLPSLASDTPPCAGCGCLTRPRAKAHAAQQATATILCNMQHST